MMRIFISYRRFEDDRSYIVGQIHERLATEFGADNIFRDTTGIHAGQDWRAVLGHEISTCRIMLVVIGPDWASLTNEAGEKRLMDPKDVTRWEVETGLQRSGVGEAVVIPLLVLNAKVPKRDELPESLQPLLEKQVARLKNYPDFADDFESLVNAIRLSLGYSVDDMSIEPYEPETIKVLSGLFWMGSQPGENIPVHETPRHPVSLPAFRLGKFPVTNRQYGAFVADTHIEVHKLLGWDGQKVPRGLENFPVAGVTWYESRDYCEWLSLKTKRSYSLPTEAQWEKACRGGASCLYPWGDTFDPSRCNQGRDDLAPVDHYPAQNDYGFFDMVANVMQWTCTLWEQDETPHAQPYPWREDGRNDVRANSETPRVLRGSVMKDTLFRHRCSARHGDYPVRRGNMGARYGFRVAMKG